MPGRHVTAMELIAAMASCSADVGPSARANLRCAHAHSRAHSCAPQRCHALDSLNATPEGFAHFRMDAQTFNDSLEAARAPPCWLDRSPWVTHYAAQARASDPCVVVSGRFVLALGFWSNGCSRSSMYCGGFSRRTLDASRIFWRRASAPSPSLSISRFMPRVGARRWRPAHAASLRRALGFYVGAPRTMHPAPTPDVVLAAGRRGQGLTKTRLSNQIDRTSARSRRCSGPRGMACPRGGRPPAGRGRPRHEWRATPRSCSTQTCWITTRTDTHSNEACG